MKQVTVKIAPFLTKCLLVSLIYLGTYNSLSAQNNSHDDSLATYVLAKLNAIRENPSRALEVSWQGMNRLKAAPALQLKQSLCDSLKARVKENAGVFRRINMTMVPLRTKTAVYLWCPEIELARFIRLAATLIPADMAYDDTAYLKTIPASVFGNEDTIAGIAVRRIEHANKTFCQVIIVTDK